MRLPTRLLFVPVIVLTFVKVTRPDSLSNLIEQGHYKRAESALRSLLQQNPGDPAANYLMSKVHIAFRRYDEAISCAEKAVSADSNRPEYHAQLAEALGSKTGDPKAGMFQKLSLAKRMRQEAELTLKSDPKNSDANSDLLDFFLDAPGMAGGSKDKARELAAHVTQIDPAQGYLLQIHFARHEKQPGEIEHLYQQAVQAAPNDYAAHIGLANFYLNQEKPRLLEAEQFARESLKIDPQRTAAYVVLAASAAKQGHLPELERVLGESEKAIPDDFSPHYQAAKVMFLGSDSSLLSRAESYFRKYLTEEPEAGSPPLSAAHWRLGLVLEKEGRKSDARTELETAVKLQPDFKDAQQDLKRLK